MINYCLVSEITSRSPTVGIQNINKITEQQNIPVTWIVTARFAEIYKDLLTEFHRNKGDQVMFQLESEDALLDNPGMEKYQQPLGNINNQEIYQSMIADQKKAMERVLPWAEINIATRSPNNIHYFRALKSEGFQAIWGFCWEYQDPDILARTGLPLGSFKLDLNSNTPLCNDDHLNQIKEEDSDPISAIQRYSVDINRAYYTKKPEIYSLKSLEAQKKKLIEMDNVEYWKKITDDYRKNSNNSTYGPIIQYQSPNEFEFTMLNSGYRHPHEIEELQSIYDLYFHYIKNLSDVKVSTLPELFQSGSELRNHAIPKYFYVEDRLKKSKSHQDLIRSFSYKRDYHLKRAIFLFKRMLGKAGNKDRVPKQPKNGINFPPIFLYQDNCTQLIYEIDNAKDLFIRPSRQFIYREDRIMRWKRYPIIYNYSIIDMKKAFEYNLEIKASIKMPWGLLIPGKFKDIDVQHLTTELSDICTQKSCGLDKHAFIYIILTEGNNKIRVAMAQRDAEINGN